MIEYRDTIESLRTASGRPFFWAGATSGIADSSAGTEVSRRLVLDCN